MRNDAGCDPRIQSQNDVETGRRAIHSILSVSDQLTWPSNGCRVSRRAILSYSMRMTSSPGTVSPAASSTRLWVRASSHPEGSGLGGGVISSMTRSESVFPSAGARQFAKVELSLVPPCFVVPPAVRCQFASLHQVAVRVPVIGLFGRGTVRMLAFHSAVQGSIECKFRKACLLFKYRSVMALFRQLTNIEGWR